MVGQDLMEECTRNPQSHTVRPPGGGGTGSKENRGGNRPSGPLTPGRPPAVGGGSTQSSPGLCEPSGKGSGSHGSLTGSTTCRGNGSRPGALDTLDLVAPIPYPHNESLSGL